MEVRLFALQVMHQSAVKSISTGLPADRASRSASGLQAVHLMESSRVWRQSNPHSIANPYPENNNTPQATNGPMLMEAARCLNSPNTHAANATNTSSTPSHNTPPLPNIGPVNDRIQIPAANIGKPMIILNCTIQSPGFGRNFSQSGRKLRIT